MRFPAGAIALLLTAGWLLPAQSSSHGASTARRNTVPPSVDPPATEKLTFDVEWRLIHAGAVVVESRRTRAGMKLESAGLVSSLFRINDTYSVDYDEAFCATGSVMDSQEGKRHREAKVTYDRNQNRATYLERDVLKDMIVRTGQVDIPSCVHDVVSAFLKFRTQALEPGQSTQIPMSDGRRSASVRLEAQGREVVKTPAGNYSAVRCEVYMLNGVIYTRKGSALVWMSDDGRRLPVQIRLRLQFPIGTVTLRLQKEEHS